MISLFRRIRAMRSSSYSDSPASFSASSPANMVDDFVSCDADF